MSNSTRPSSSNSASTTSYDERFVVPLEASRRGAHRARVSPVMAVLPVAAVVGIVIGAIALVYLFLGGTGSSDTAATTVVAPSTSPTASASASPSVSASASGASSMATTSASAGTVDKTLTVAVFNGTNASGLARKASSKLSAAGWTLGTVATWTGAPVSQTTVYYSTGTQRATALAVAKSLGHGVARLSSKAGTGLTVVVGNDYPGAGTARMTGAVLRTTARSSTAGASTTRAPTHSATKSTSPKASAATATTTSSPTG